MVFCALGFESQASRISAIRSCSDARRSAGVWSGLFDGKPEVDDEAGDLITTPSDRAGPFGGLSLHHVAMVMIFLQQPAVSNRPCGDVQLQYVDLLLNRRGRQLEALSYQLLCLSLALFTKLGRGLLRAWLAFLSVLDVVLYRVQ